MKGFCASKVKECGLGISRQRLSAPLWRNSMSFLPRMDSYFEAISSVIQINLRQFAKTFEMGGVRMLRYDLQDVQKEEFSLFARSMKRKSRQLDEYTKA